MGPRGAAEKGKAGIVSLSTGPVLKGVFEPGWRWSEHVKPIAGTDGCQTAWTFLRMTASTSSSSARAELDELAASLGDRHVAGREVQCVAADALRRAAEGYAAAGQLLNERRAREALEPRHHEVSA